MQDENGIASAQAGPGASPPWTRRLSWLAVACVFASTFGYGAHRARFGLDASDEGLYLAAPMRYALGDVPFRDEFFTPHRMFDLVLSPLFYLVPDISILELRWLWMTVQFGAMIAVFVVFRRFAPDIVVALASASTIWFGNLIWTPGYHLMGTYLYVLALATWLYACLSEQRRVQSVLGAFSGIALFLAALSYLPAAATALIPATVLVTAIAQQRNGRVHATLFHLGSAGLLALSSLLTLAVTGLVPDWIEAHQAFTSYATYGSSISDKLSLFIDQTEFYWPIVLGTSLGVVSMNFCVKWLPALSRFGKRAGGIGVLFMTVAAVAGLRALAHEMPLSSADRFDYPLVVYSLRLVAFVLGLHVGAMLIWVPRLRRPGKVENDWTLVYSCAVSGAAILGFLHGFLSIHAFKTMWGLLPLTVAGVVLVYRAFLAGGVEPLQRALATILAVVLCGVIGEFSHTARADFVYRGASRRAMTGEFGHPKLAGIRSEPATVAAIESVVEYLSKRVKPGDFLLAYDEIPLFYFLTQTRPALDHAFTSMTSPIELRARSVDRMIERGRVPRYVLFSQRLTRPKEPPDPAVSPIHSFVVENYRREASFRTPALWDPGSARQLEVWVLHPAGIRKKPALGASPAARNNQR